MPKTQGRHRTDRASSFRCCQATRLTAIRCEGRRRAGSPDTTKRRSPMPTNKRPLVIQITNPDNHQLPPEEPMTRSTEIDMSIITDRDSEPIHKLTGQRGVGPVPPFNVNRVEKTRARLCWVLIPFQRDCDPTHKYVPDKSGRSHPPRRTPRNDGSLSLSTSPVNGAKAESYQLQNQPQGEPTL